MDLFDQVREKVLEGKAPLAARMRPRTLEEFAGQRHVLGAGRLLRRAIQADQLSSLIFHGPPGTGKTTLARIIANTTRGHFSALNAVLAGVADIRAAVAEAQARLGEQERRTILFVDEVHRFNKAQQDALLPHVENGTVILIGATTENPYFEVNKPLVSRSRIFELKPLEDADIRAILESALADPERGYGRLKTRVEPAALAHLADVANGDARAALNALELAVETTPPGKDGAIRIGLEVAEESIQRRAVLYDKEGDAHFDAISAFIKSLRGSDPDAALYWMARMFYAGEDPRFIFRRMIVFAAEDVGLADPDALRVTMSAAQAYDYVGLPEGRFHLAEACLYLATAPKSHSAFSFFDALGVVEKERSGEVPNHLKDASRDGEGLGHGQGYLYPHAYRDHWVAQQYLPESLRGRVFYQPGEAGFENTLRGRVQRNREAALAALREGGSALSDHFPGGGPAPEAKKPGAGGEWTARGRSTLGQQLGLLRERIFALAELKREHLVLDANAGSGLLVFEAARKAAVGGVWARVGSAREAEALRDGIRLLPALAEPVLIECALDSLPDGIAGRGEGTVRFDRILARNLMGRHPDKAARIALLGGLLAPGGRLVLAERVPRLGERLLASLDWAGMPEGIARAAIEAEASLYEDPDDPLVNWEGDDLERWCREAGLATLDREILRQPVELAIGPQLVEDWFGSGSGEEGKPPPPEAPTEARPSTPVAIPAAEAPPPGGKLAARLGSDADAVRTYLERTLTGAPLRRTVAVALLAVERK